MQPLDTQGYSPTLEKIIRGGLEPAPPPILGSRFAFPLQSALQTVGILRKPSSMVTRALSGVQKKRFIIVGLDAAGKSTLMKKHIAKPGQEVELRYPIIGFYIRCVGDYESGNEFYTTDLGACDGHGKAVGRATCVQGDAIIWVMDSNDRDRSVEVREELFECLNLVPERLAVRQKSAGVARAVQTSPVAILINKRDLEVGFPCLFDIDKSNPARHA
ncbi:unnamed protein product [Periconia digitata]|uniref:ADP-ribosylation factor n=1 Tax=Periconia digitata TaxID=1303443 RepID=A0A9W4UEJ8_9PLEO|nr:unnamed protein product [Periconia digitata]